MRSPGTSALARLVGVERTSVRSAERTRFMSTRPSQDRLIPLSLFGLDDRAADRSGPGEQVFELFALAPADCALQSGQVFGEAAQHFQHRLAIVEENIPPHDWIGSGDAREVAKAGCRELDHLAPRRLLKPEGSADDGISDQMRKMRGDRQDLVMMPRLHQLDRAAGSPPQLGEALDRPFIGAG